MVVGEEAFSARDVRGNAFGLRSVESDQATSGCVLRDSTSMQQKRSLLCSYYLSLSRINIRHFARGVVRRGIVVGRRCALAIALRFYTPKFVFCRFIKRGYIAP